MTDSIEHSASVSIHYQRSKALAFGLLMLAIGGAICWVAWDALDSAWRSPNNDGALLQALPAWIRVPFFVLIGSIILIPGAMMLFAGITNRVIVHADAERITSRTIFGRRRALPWNVVGSVKRWGKENQIVLSPIGHGGLREEIWDRQSILIDVGMLDWSVSDVEQMIRRFRPDLTIDYGESRDG